jgi:hypothetical protein
VDGGGVNSTIIVDPNVTASVTGLTIQNGNGLPKGEGGGVLNDGRHLTLRNDIITGNTAAGGTSDATTGGIGGGVYNNFNSVLDIFRTTISGNSAPNAPDPTGNGTGLGGGIYDRGSSLLLVNSTVTGNSAGRDAGIRARLGDMKIVNSTIDANSAVLNTGNDPTTAPIGGGIEISSLNTNAFSIGNTIIANNTAQAAAPGTGTTPSDCLDRQATPAAGSAFTSLGHNLIGNGGGCDGFKNGTSGDQVGAAAAPKDPHLGALSDNGGPTLTQLPASGSSAIDAGSNTLCADPATVDNIDQRGAPRPFGASCDIGSVEAGAHVRS